MKLLQYIWGTFRTIADPFDKFNKNECWLLLDWEMSKYIRKIKIFFDDRASVKIWELKSCKIKLPYTRKRNNSNNTYFRRMSTLSLWIKICNIHRPSSIKIYRNTETVDEETRSIDFFHTRIYYEIKYVEGKSNIVSNAFSRLTKWYLLQAILSETS